MSRLTKWYPVPCAHGEHGPCLKCQLIEERLADSFEARQYRKLARASLDRQGK